MGVGCSGNLCPTAIIQPAELTVTGVCSGRGCDSAAEHNQRDLTSIFCLSRQNKTKKQTLIV